jgi:hypothetical protein
MTNKSMYAKQEEADAAVVGDHSLIDFSPAR